MKKQHYLEKQTIGSYFKFKSFANLLTYLLLNLFNVEVKAQGVEYPHLAMQSSPIEVSELYLDKHDIVYKSPTVLEAEGLPLGNGNLGGMIWNHESGFEIQINKNDLWTGKIKSEENKSILRHAARLKIDFGFPTYSWIHLKDYTARLSLRKGEVTINSQNPFAKTKVENWLASDKNVWIIECENEFNNEMLPKGSTATISLERIGSRAFAGWYGGSFPKDPAASIGITSIKQTSKDLILTEKQEGLSFTVVCRVLQDSDTPEIVNNYRGRIKSNAKKLTILITVVSDKESSNPEQEAVELLNETEENTISKLKQERIEWFKNFWSNSFVKIGDDYIENIYYLRRFLMAAGSQGQYPITFNGGLWRWNRDVMNWVTPHHWNTQQQYWGILAQNDIPLMRPYLKTYFKMIPFAEASAKRRGNKGDAILISEAHDFDGRQVSEEWTSMRYNFSVAPQISALFWDYFKFTNDKNYLRDTAFVFMHKALNFYLEKLEWNESKKCYELISSIYESESIEKLKNSESDRNALEALLKNTIEAAKILKKNKEEIKKWEFVLHNLWQRQYETVIECGETIAPATEYFTKERSSPYNWAIAGAIAFPGNLIGIDQANDRIGKAVANFIKCRNFVNAHHPVSIIAARMGLGDNALAYLTNGINTHQFYPQGFMTNVTGYPENLYDLQSVHDVIGRYKIKSYPFFQAGMEAISNYATTINEMLMQSNEGKIRVFPAIPTAWKDSTLAFTLRARDGFIVSAIAKDKVVASQIGIKSLFGSICRIHNPWPQKDVYIYEIAGNKMKNVKYKFKNEVLVFETEINKEYIILPKNEISSIEKIKIESVQNNKPKKFKTKKLGRESGWNDGFLN